VAINLLLFALIRHTSDDTEIGQNLELFERHGPALATGVAKSKLEQPYHGSLSAGVLPFTASKSLIIILSF
jgi:hypothetical protein